MLCSMGGQGSLGIGVLYMDLLVEIGGLGGSTVEFVAFKMMELKSVNLQFQLSFSVRSTKTKHTSCYR
jgi:hypothetical protein